MVVVYQTVARRYRQPREDMPLLGLATSTPAGRIMFFGTLFTSLAVYHVLYATAFQTASSHLNWQIGTINTFVLLISSLMMAFIQPQ